MVAQEHQTLFPALQHLTLVVVGVEHSLGEPQALAALVAVEQVQLEEILCLTQHLERLIQAEVVEVLALIVLHRWQAMAAQEALA